LNPEPIADFTDVIAVGEGEVLAPKIIDAIFEHETKPEILLGLARETRLYVPSLYHVAYKTDGTIDSYTPTEEGAEARRTHRGVGESKEGSLRRAIRRKQTDVVAELRREACLRRRLLSGHRKRRWASVF
jgi:hypothetical protein